MEAKLAWGREAAGDNPLDWVDDFLDSSPHVPPIPYLQFWNFHWMGTRMDVGHNLVPIFMTQVK